MLHGEEERPTGLCLRFFFYARTGPTSALSTSTSSVSSCLALHASLYYALLDQPIIIAMAPVQGDIPLACQHLVHPTDLIS